MIHNLKYLCVTDFNRALEVDLVETVAEQMLECIKRWSEEDVLKARIT